MMCHITYFLMLMIWYWQVLVWQDSRRWLTVQIIILFHMDFRITLPRHCATFGRKAQQTGWFIGGCKLAETDRIEYIGAVISDNPFHHAESRMSACRRAFYALQGVGLFKRGTNPDTIRYLWMTVLRPVLTYGISCMNMPPKTIESLEKCQTKLLKATLGLISYCRNTPILQAMNIKRISQFIGESQRDVKKSPTRNETKGLKFYSCILSLGQSDMNSITGRTTDDVSMIRYLYDDIYILVKSKDNANL